MMKPVFGLDCNQFVQVFIRFHRASAIEQFSLLSGTSMPSMIFKMFDEWTTKDKKCENAKKKLVIKWNTFITKHFINAVTTFMNFQRIGVRTLHIAFTTIFGHFIKRIINIMKRENEWKGENSNINQNNSLLLVHKMIKQVIWFSILPSFGWLQRLIMIFIEINHFIRWSFHIDYLYLNIPINSVNLFDCYQQTIITGSYSTITQASNLDSISQDSNPLYCYLLL